MRPAAIVLFVCSVILSSGCSSQPANNQPASTPAVSTSPAANAVNANSAAPTARTSAAIAKLKLDACSALTSEEIQAVQGEPLKSTKPTDRTSGNFITGTCYYELPTPSNSVSLSLTENDPDKRGQTVKDFWEEKFGKSERKDSKEAERDRKEKKTEARPEQRREGEEEESAAMEPVRGIGDEAFWSGSRVGGALYVLKGDRYLRISVGGAGDNEAKLKKSKKLAQKVLRKM